MALPFIKHSAMSFCVVVKLQSGCTMLRVQLSVWTGLVLIAVSLGFR